MIRLTKDATKEEFYAACEKMVQHWPCWENGTCRYRGEDGNACVIGLFLPDDLAYRIEGYSVGQLLAGSDHTGEYSHAVRSHLPTWIDDDLAARLQAVHDGVGNSDKSDILAAIRDLLSL